MVLSEETVIPEKYEVVVRTSEIVLGKGLVRADDVIQVRLLNE